MIWILIAIAALLLVCLAAYIITRPIYGIYLGIALSGILITPELPVVGTKLATPDIPFMLAIIGVCIHAAVGKLKLKRPDSLAVRAALLFLALFLLTSSFSYSFGGIRLGSLPLQSTITLLNYAYGALITVAVLVLVDDWKKWRNCLLAWMVGVTIVTSVGLLAMAGFGPEWTFHANRLKSTLRAVNQLPSYVAPALVVLSAFMLSAARRPVLNVMCLLLLLGGVATILATGSRTGVVLLALTLIAGAFYGLRDARKSPFIAAVALSSIVIVMLSVVYTFSIVYSEGADALPSQMQAIARPIRMTQEAASFDDQLGSRAEQADIALSNWTRYPVFGVGPGDFQYVFNYREEVHNTYLGVLIEHGVLGLFLLLSYIGLVLYYGFWNSRGEPGSLQILVVASVFAFFILLLYGITMFGLRQRVFWFLSALILAAVSLSRQSTSARRRFMPRAEVATKSQLLT